MTAVILVGLGTPRVHHVPILSGAALSEPEETVKNFGKQTPIGRAGQPAELATAYVMLADPLSSYTSGTTVAVTGGKPFI